MTRNLQMMAKVECMEKDQTETEQLGLTLPNFFRQHAASIYGFVRQSVCQFCPKNF